MERVRVLLAEDHPAVAQRLRDMLATEFDVIGTVSNGQDLIAAVQRLQPDVVVTDIGMPVLDGLQAAQILLKEDPRRRVVIISVYEDQALIKRAGEIGVRGYVTKASGCANLIAAVHEAWDTGNSRAAPDNSGPTKKKGAQT